MQPVRLFRRHNPPEDSEAPGGRELQALYAENFSVWPGWRRAAIIEQAEWAEELREDETGAMRNPMPTEVYQDTGGDLYRWEEVTGPWA
jgi:hypothetical protein